MEKKPMRSYIKLIIPLLMLLIVFIVLFILRKGILFELKYDIEYDDELNGYILTDIAIHDDPMLVLPSHTPDGKQIVGASGLFTEEHIFEVSVRASGIEEISLSAPTVMPFCTRAE